MYKEYRFKNIKEVKDTLKNKSFIILSGKDNTLLLDDLVWYRYKYIKILTGWYQGKREVSFLVELKTFGDVSHLEQIARKYKQKSIIEALQDVIWLVYLDEETKTETSKRKYVYKNATKYDCYTTVQCLNGEEISFHINFK